MKKTWSLIFNKFVLTGALFLIWMLFFDQNDWQSQRQRKKDLKTLEQNMAYLQEEIHKMESEYNQLIQDPVVLERYAREHFRMKRDNEDVYVPSSLN